jgi:hypothetical protein
MVNANHAFARKGVVFCEKLFGKRKEVTWWRKGHHDTKVLTKEVLIRPPRIVVDVRRTRSRYFPEIVCYSNVISSPAQEPGGPNESWTMYRLLNIAARDRLEPRCSRFRIMSEG